jgi:hypothetical protein
VWVLPQRPGKIPFKCSAIYYLYSGDMVVRSRPPLQSSGPGSALPVSLSSSGSETGSTEPRDELLGRTSNGRRCPPRWPIWR